MEYDETMTPRASRNLSFATRLRTVDELVRSAVAVLRKLNVRATTTKMRRSSQETRSSTLALAGRCVFAATRCDNFSIPARTIGLCYLATTRLSGKSCGCTSFSPFGACEIGVMRRSIKAAAEFYTDQIS